MAARNILTAWRENIWTKTRTATEIIEQDYLPLEQTIVNQFRDEGMSDEEILQFLREFS